ncbi:MAG: hypothetical protein QME16_01745 [Planctomycetota bacterium]|nr:hypothetical protein [Planctomycetota bacterium]
MKSSKNIDRLKRVAYNKDKYSPFPNEEGRPECERHSTNPDARTGGTGKGTMALRRHFRDGKRRN